MKQTGCDLVSQLYPRRRTAWGFPSRECNLNDTKLSCSNVLDAINFIIILWKPCLIKINLDVNLSYTYFCSLLGKWIDPGFVLDLKIRKSLLISQSTHRRIGVVAASWFWGPAGPRQQVSCFNCLSTEWQLLFIQSVVYNSRFFY